MSLNNFQQRFFDKTIKIKKVRDILSSPQEYEFKEILNAIGLKEETDYFHQVAFTDEDSIVAVADFSVPKHKIIIELDDSHHREKKRAAKDAVRDSIFRYNGFCTFRIKTPMTQESKNYWKVFLENFIKIGEEQERHPGGLEI